MDTMDWKSVIAALPENNRFDPAEKNDSAETPTLRLSAEIRPSATGSLLGMSDAVEADVSIVNHGTDRINIKEVGLQVDGGDIPFPFEVYGTGDQVPDHLPAQDSFEFSRILHEYSTLEKIRNHHEINVYVIDGIRRRLSGKVIVDSSLSKSIKGSGGVGQAKERDQHAKWEAGD